MAKNGSESHWLSPHRPLMGVWVSYLCGPPIHPSWGLGGDGRISQNGMEPYLDTINRGSRGTNTDNCSLECMGPT